MQSWDNPRSNPEGQNLTANLYPDDVPRTLTPDLPCRLLAKPGSGLRLSWPNAGDGRRAIVAKSQSHKNRPHHLQDARIVHVSHRDVEMHYHFTRSALNGK